MLPRVETCAPSPIERHSEIEASRAAWKRAASSGSSFGAAASAVAKVLRMVAAHGDHGATAGWNASPCVM